MQVFDKTKHRPPLQYQPDVRVPLRKKKIISLITELGKPAGQAEAQRDNENLEAQ